MDSPIAELFTVAIEAALREAGERSGVFKARIATICEVYGIGGGSENIQKLPEPARSIAVKYVSEYLEWDKAAGEAHRLIADLRREMRDKVL